MQLAKVNLNTQSVLAWRQDNVFPGEPVFVEHPNATSEDDGVLLSVVLDIGNKSSSLVIIDAKSLEQLATARLPSIVPFGFHGIFVAQ